VVNPEQSRSIAGKACKRTSRVGGRNLRVCQRRRLAHAEEVGSNCRYAGEKTWKREWLTLADIRTTEARDVTNEAQAEVVVEETEAAADNRLGSGGPGETDARRNIVLLIECGVVVPA